MPLYEFSDFLCLIAYSRLSNFLAIQATVAITGYKGANLDLCLVLTAF
jgi:hypothetical protein